MKKIILSLLVLIGTPINCFADYGMIKLPADQIVKQNNSAVTSPQTYTPSAQNASSTIKTAVAVPAVQPPSLPQPSAIMAKLTGSFDDAFSQLVNLLSQKDFKIISYDMEKGFIVAQNMLTGDRIFSVLGTYNNQCFVKISCLSSSCSSMSRFSGM